MFAGCCEVCGFGEGEVDWDLNRRAQRKQSLDWLGSFGDMSHLRRLGSLLGGFYKYVASSGAEEVVVGGVAVLFLTTVG